MARTRSAEAHAKVLDAAAELFVSRGIEATSMDAIAAASGVSKATLYKHWPDKDSLCLETLSRVLGLEEQRPIFNTGDFRADAVAQLSYDPCQRRDMKDRLMPQVVAYSATNRTFGRAWRMRMVGAVRQAFTDLIRRGQKAGALRAKIDLDLAIALLVGPKIYQNIFVDALGSAAPKRLEPGIVDAFLAAFGAPERSGKKA